MNEIKNTTRLIGLIGSTYSLRRYMATSGLERKIKIWDLRTYKCMHEFKVPSGAGSMNFSSRGLLAAGMGNTVSVYKVLYEYLGIQLFPCPANSHSVLWSREGSGS